MGTFFTFFSRISRQVEARTTSRRDVDQLRGRGQTNSFDPVSAVERVDTAAREISKWICSNCFQEQPWTAVIAYQTSRLLRTCTDHIENGCHPSFFLRDVFTVFSEILTRSCSWLLVVAHNVNLCKEVKYYSRSLRKKCIEGKIAKGIIRYSNIGARSNPTYKTVSSPLNRERERAWISFQETLYLYECRGKSRSLSNTYYACQLHRYLSTVVSIACNERPNFLLSVTRLKRILEESFEKPDDSTTLAREPRNLQLFLFPLNFRNFSFPFLNRIKRKEERISILLQSPLSLSHNSSQ